MLISITCFCYEVLLYRRDSALMQYPTCLSIIEGFITSAYGASTQPKKPSHPRAVDLWHDMSQASYQGSLTLPSLWLLKEALLTSKRHHTSLFSLRFLWLFKGFFLITLIFLVRWALMGSFFGYQAFWGLIVDGLSALILLSLYGYGKKLLPSGWLSEAPGRLWLKYAAGLAAEGLDDTLSKRYQAVTDKCRFEGQPSSPQVRHLLSSFRFEKEMSDIERLERIKEGQVLFEFFGGGLFVFLQLLEPFSTMILSL